jgi:hypothetical protein
MDDGLGDPVAETRQIVLPQIGADRHVVLVAADAGPGVHVAGLTGEVTRRAILEVGVLSRVPGAMIGDVRSAPDMLQLRRQRCEIVDQRGLPVAGVPLGGGPLHHAVGVGGIVECGLALDRASRNTTEGARLQHDLLGAMVVSEIAYRGIADGVAGATEIAVPMKGGAERPMIGLLVTLGVRPESRPPAIDDPLPGAVVALAGLRIEGLEGRILLFRRARNVDLLVGIHHQVAELALDAAVVGGVETAAVGRCRAAGKPAPDTVAADTEIARAAALGGVGVRQEVLLGDRHRRPEERVATGVAHHAAFPAPARLPLRIAGVVVAAAG